MTGYPEILLPEKISQGLNTRIFGTHILYREETETTQELARQLAELGADEGTVAICEKQLGGRGRRGRTFVSPPHVGIYFSIVLRPQFKPSAVMQIPLLTGVAVSRAIAAVTLLHPRIKWPNDIILNGKKACGILAEMKADRDVVDYVILGIGVNVNTPGEMFPEDIALIATSLAAEAGKNVSRIKLIQSILENLETLYYGFLTQGFAAIRKEWKKWDNTLGSRVEIRGDNEIILGQAIDMDEEGFLLVRTDSGEMKRIVGGDISLRFR